MHRSGQYSLEVCRLIQLRCAWGVAREVRGRQRQSVCYGGSSLCRGFPLRRLGFSRGVSVVVHAVISGGAVRVVVGILNC